MLNADASASGLHDALRLEVEEVLLASDVGPRLREAVTWALSQTGRALHWENRFRWSMLPLFVYQSYGGEPSRALPAAAAIDLWLAAGDVLDEVEDRDVPGLWDVVGDAQAINAATALLFLTQQAAYRLRHRGFDDRTTLRVAGEISMAGLRSCNGQHLDLLNESSIDIQEDDYFRMTGLRSGSLFECACRVGAVLAGQDEEVVETLGRAGCNLGIFAQISNDVRSLDSAFGNKTDVVRRKKSLPILYGLQVADGRDRQWLSDVFSGSEEATSQVKARVKELLSNLGATKYSLIVADVYRQKGLEALAEGGMPEPMVNALGEMLGQ